jgi:hypothetical protein
MREHLALVPARQIRAGRGRRQVELRGVTRMLGQRAAAGDDELHRGHDDLERAVGDAMLLSQNGLQPALAHTLRPCDKLLNGEGNSNRGDEQRLRRPPEKRHEGDLANSGARDTSHRECEDQCEREGGRDLRRAEADRGQNTDQRAEGTDCRDLTEGKIDPVGQPIDEAIGDGEQRVERCRWARVDDLLKEIPAFETEREGGAK